MDYSRRPGSTRKVSCKPCKRAGVCPGHTGMRGCEPYVFFPDSCGSRELLPDRKQLQLRRHSSDYAMVGFSPLRRPLYRRSAPSRWGFPDSTAIINEESNKVSRVWSRQKFSFTNGFIKRCVNRPRTARNQSPELPENTLSCSLDSLLHRFGSEYRVIGKLTVMSIAWK